MYHRYHRWNKCQQSEPSTFANEHYMNTPQKKEKMKMLKKRVRVAEHSVARLQEKVKTTTLRR
jgi:hypothetical protein